MNTDQIAAEAETKLDGLLYSYSEVHRRNNIAIIQAAIEKARDTEDLMYRYHNDARFNHFVQELIAHALSRAAHASELPKEDYDNLVRDAMKWRNQEATPATGSEHPRCDVCNEWILPNHVAVHEGDKLVHACCRNPDSASVGKDEPDQIDMMSEEELRSELRKLVNQVTATPSGGGEKWTVEQNKKWPDRYSVVVNGTTLISQLSRCQATTTLASTHNDAIEKVTEVVTAERDHYKMLTQELGQELNNAQSKLP